MEKDEILNRLSLKKYDIHFNQINGMYDRAIILNKALDEVLKQVNLTIPGVMPSLPDKETVSEPIQNALFATGKINTEQADNITNGILTYLNDAGFAIKWKQ